MRFVAQRPPLRFLTTIAIALAAAMPGCGSCGTSQSQPADTGAAVLAAEPVVPAPEGLLAEGWIRRPDALWAKVQTGVSGAVALLPPTAGELACAAARLDTRVAPLVDGKGISYVALADGAGGRVAWTIALPITDAAAAARMLIGDGARASASRAVAGLRVVGGAGPASGVVAALGSRWLVLAGGDDDLERLGPYVVGTLPSKPAPTDPAAIVADVPQSALAGPLSRRVAARWEETRAWLSEQDEEQRAKHGGRPPDFGDPRVLVDALDAAVKRRLALVSGARAARVTVEAAGDEMHAELVLTPGADPASVGLLAAMHPGTARPLAESPADAIVAVLARDDAAERDEDAAAFESTLERALGERLREEDTRAIHTGVTDWARERGDWWTAGLAWGETDAGRGLWLRTPAAGGEASPNAVRELLDLSHRSALRELFAGSLHLAPAVFTSADVAGLGKANVATFAATSAKAKAEASGALGVAWAVHDGQWLVAAGPSAPSVLAGAASPGARLGDDPGSAAAIAALGDDATFAVFARPLRVDVPRYGAAASAAPAVIAWGRKGDAAWARLQLADVLLRELLHLESGL